ncbi:MAG: hypothetical protein LBO67_05250 [Spirochaetaceae bacterium]|nr:hypothetical protein [Spirochaetaceae bacterium]
MDFEPLRAARYSVRQFAQDGLNKTAMGTPSCAGAQKCTLPEQCVPPAFLASGYQSPRQQQPQSYPLKQAACRSDLSAYRDLSCALH